MTRTIGLLMFDDAEELDFVGPYEVFTMASEVLEADGGEGYKVLLIAERDTGIRCAKGMRVLPDCTTATAPKLDVLLVPGGNGTRREAGNAALLAWIAKVAGDCEWVTSVCTGALLLTAAGPARGKRVTTHWTFVEALRARNEGAEVLDDMRWVRDGNVVSAAGVSAGIDMALWLVGQWESPAVARETQRQMEYHPAPPYAAAV